MLFLTKNANKTPLKLILTTEAFSSLTNQFMQLLLPWYVLSSTGSILWTGVVAFCALLPNIFSSLFGAPVIDKFGRSSTMLFCEVTQFLLLTAIPMLIILGYDKPWLIGLLIFLSSFFDAPGQLARTALSPTFSRYAGVPLAKTSGIIEAFDGIMAVAGPLLGGVVIAACGLLSAWGLCSVFCLIIVCLCIWVFTSRRPRARYHPVPYKAAFANIYNDPILFESILATMPLFILGQSWELIVLPSYIYEHGFTSMYLGVLGAAFGLGAFVGALFFAAAAKRFRFFTLLTVNYLGYMLSVLVLLFVLPKWAVAVTTVLCGVPFGAFGAMIISIILLRTPEELRSKTLGIFATATYTVESVCVLLISVGMHYLGLNRTLFIVTCIFGILVVVSVFARKKNDFWAVLNAPQKNERFTN